jgi:hypothetical protein
VGRNAVGAWVLVTASACGVAAAQSSLVEWREQVIPGVCTLRIAAPQGWEVRMGVPVAGAVDIRIKPPEGARGEILISGMVPKGGPALKSNGDIKATVRTMGQAMLEGSLEKKVAIEKVSGSGGNGFFYSLTDKRQELPAGEFRFMTQGIMAVGPLRLATTVLGDAAASPARTAAFDLLRTAECSPGSAPPAK